VQWGIVWRLAAGSVPAAVITLWVLAGQEAKHATAVNGVITTALAWALVATAIAMLFRKTIVAFVTRRIGALSPRLTTVLTIVLGAILGVLVSLTSVGAGALGMTVLLILYPKTDTAKLVGSDIAHAVPLTLLAGIGHWMMGSVDWRLLVSLLCGSIPGIVIGSLLAVRMPDRVLRPILAGTLALVALKMMT
jgi:uncharacterized membrane protein YfcA